MSGKLIVIEGGDSSGKATQTALLKERLESDGLQVEVMDFPRYEDNQVGSLIKECLDGKHGDFIGTDPRLAAVLYAADRRESLTTIRQWIADGKVIIFDRYTSASLLHQGAKHTGAEGQRVVMEWIFNLEHNIFNIPEPDLLLYLDVPAPERMKLLAAQSKELDLAEKNDIHQMKVDTVADVMLQMYKNSTKIDCMDGDTLRKKEDIATEIHRHVADILKV